MCKGYICRHRCSRTLSERPRNRKISFLLVEKAEVLMTSITAFELPLGANLSKKREQRRGEVESLINQHKIVAFNRESASMAAERGAELKIEGTQLEIRDLFNAYICLTEKTPILTNNKAHYEKK
ncbi:MAG: type II toxin-antitoxin system VapC family toxin [Candidatus Bathyarchaeia archaeon]